MLIAVRPTQHIPSAVGTPDSRITSLECGTTKSCATIPEDDELSVVSEDDRTNEIDLLSIDRVIFSLLIILINFSDLCKYPTALPGSSSSSDYGNPSA